jgi:hypothetical protein
VVNKRFKSEGRKGGKEEGFTNIGELPVLKDHKVMLDSQPCQLLGKLNVEIIHNVNMSL